MTTITIKNGKLQKTHFEGFSEFLQYLAKNDEDFNDPDFKDTVLTEELIERAKKTREAFNDCPENFNRAIQ
ncbi:hypothetical protein POV26_01220 [Aequorivita todarodis]|uniref:hypothetical protein n=1 Tax=Aequorivita todarodis TaxID=2036821 RepID=UPI002350030F|nr:hypothetical protein [Aequorivita todarodis]MDC7999649.1 hypothetical protein [Aequorivita todarodis]